LIRHLPISASPSKKRKLEDSPRNFDISLRIELELLYTPVSISNTPPSTGSSQNYEGNLPNIDVNASNPDRNSLANSIEKIPNPITIITTLPDYTQSGRYNGSTAAARWLTRLGYDFRKAGYEEPSASLFFEAVDILFDSEAA
jgi:hypothetical protein